MFFRIRRFLFGDSRAIPVTSYYQIGYTTSVGLTSTTVCVNFESALDWVKSHLIEVDSMTVYRCDENGTVKLLQIKWGAN